MDLEPAREDPDSDSSKDAARRSDSELTNTTTTSIHTGIHWSDPEQPRPMSEVASESNQLAIRRRYECMPTRVPNVNAEMEKWYAMADRYGFLEDGVSEVDPKQKEKEVERSEKWARMATHQVFHGEDVHSFVQDTKFINRVYKGIPDCWRRDAWYYLCSDGLQQAKNDDKLREAYTDLLSRPTSHERQIDLDIPRTMHGHIMFRERYGSGQRALFNVLRAFANYDEDVGYCQGMTNVAAMLLMYCEEEKAFLILVHMFLRDQLHNLFVPGFPALMESFYIQDTLVQRYLPKLFRHLTEIGLTSDVYATRWYITLFTGGVIQYHTLLRIWDIYFLCGFDIFYFVSVVLLKSYQEQLLRGDLETCMSVLGGTMSVPDDDKFIKAVRRLYERSVSGGTVKALRKQYQSRLLS
ncbi:hypothetical protein EC973_006410 [Apophysomyces ossiformis]|uniref:Rab-GAP TBC domain-containing protein n=1 Tax=Apophysomyces ossiformis TaxID=679940 RepID=A0A8H7BXX4_9FUNG|nr:hypothetical protein EC973_006410 [Apophysomyces ossiformis]